MTENDRTTARQQTIWLTEILVESICAKLREKGVRSVQDLELKARSWLENVAALSPNQAKIVADEMVKIGHPMK